MTKRITRIQGQYRQGDVLIERVDAGLVGEVSVTETAIERDGGKVILARGEATGHHHSVAERGGTAFATTHDHVTAFLGIATPTEVRHQEHGVIPLATGDHVVIRQREYSARGIRRSAD